MSSPFTRRLRSLVPAAIWRRMSEAYWWWRNRGRHRIAAGLSPTRRRSVRSLRRLAGSHAGSRCFILGNGPSLRKTDLTLLRNEITFGMNRIYLAFPEMGFPTSYYVAVNDLVLEQCASEIAALPMTRFVAWRGRRWLPADPGLVYLDTDFTGPPAFARDVSGRVFEGSTVTYVALQIAYHMGFEEVILIGVDHHFDRKGEPNSTVISEEEDRDHFHPGYFGRGFRWQLPDLAASEAAYRMAREVFEASGRRIVDATIDGALTIFPKVDYLAQFPPPASGEGS